MKRRDFIKTTAGAIAAAYIPFSGAASIPAEVSCMSRTGNIIGLKRSDVADLAKSLQRKLLLKSTPHYHQERTLWNGLSDDKLPALIAQCIDSDDVINAVNFARSHDLLVTVRGGGHGISGKAVENDTLLIDLSKMSNLSADPTTMMATARLEFY